MKRTYRLIIAPLALAVGCAYAADHTDNESQTLDPVVVTGAAYDSAMRTRIDPKAAIQPLPANDGAGLLRSVPNMSVIRKGGSSGDPLFRGLGGSRLNIQADGQYIYGGCSSRMDPPTAYIFPAAYDRVLVTKGPQTVTQGMGLVAGSVRFVRKEPKFDRQKAHLNAGITGGSFGRFDAFAEGTAGTDLAYARFNASFNKSDDYTDGGGRKVHSHFKRNSQMLQAGLTPDSDTLIAATYERSRGEAAYADRMMDGSKFDRDAWNIRARRSNIAPWLSEVSFTYGQSKIDHIMDNFSLRTPPATAMGHGGHMHGHSGHMHGHGGGKALMNPVRKTDTAQLQATFDFNQSLEIQAGLDYMRDRHRSRMDLAKDYVPTQSFRQWGAFAEGNWKINGRQNLIAGYRHDEVKGVYHEYDNDDSAKNQNYRLNSGFIRIEQNIADVKYYAGLGTAERAPDYWERNRSDTLKPERNTQLDIGAIWQNERWETSLSLFGSRIHNFILTQTGQVRARNIDAGRFGGEAEIKYRFAPNWSVSSSLAYTRGSNRTDRLPLAQTPPLEFTGALNWDNGTFSAGALWRVAAAQKRFALGQGNIIGQDVGASAGFGVLSLNGGWRINRNFLLQAGVDNVFDKEYAEFVSKGGNPAAGTQTLRVNEPGRQLWLRLQAKF